MQPQQEVGASIAARRSLQGHQAGILGMSRGQYCRQEVPAGASGRHLGYVKGMALLYNYYAMLYQHSPVLAFRGWCRATRCHTVTLLAAGTCRSWRQKAGPAAHHPSRQDTPKHIADHTRINLSQHVSVCQEPNYLSSTIYHVYHRSVYVYNYYSDWNILSVKKLLRDISPPLELTCYIIAYSLIQSTPSNLYLTTIL